MKLVFITCSPIKTCILETDVLENQSDLIKKLFINLSANNKALVAYGN